MKYRIITIFTVLAMAAAGLAAELSSVGTASRPDYRVQLYPAAT